MNNWWLLVCMERQVIWSEIDITLRNFERSYHLSCWQWLNLNLDTEFIVHIWLNWFHDSTAYISSSGNDMSHIWFTISSMYFVYQKESSIGWISKFDHCYKLLPAYQTIILYCLVVRSNIVVLYYCILFDLFESNNKKCNFLELNVLFLQLFNIANVKLHIQHSKYIHIIW